jgi:hypothetical protein
MPYVTTAVLSVNGTEEEIGTTTWPEAQAVIKKLGQHEAGNLLLYGDHVRQPAVMMIEFDAKDGEMPWSCHVHRPQWSHLLLNPKAKRILDDGIRLPLKLVMKAAEEFFETGKRKRSLVWGRAKKPLLDVFGMLGRSGDDDWL